MPCDFDPTETGEPLYRVGRDPNPWAWVEWAHVGKDGTFGSRWDDPMGNYRVLYACSSRVGAFVEKLADFRPDPEVVDGLAEIDEDDADEETVPAGSVSAEWLERTRMVGDATTAGVFADVGTGRSLAYLRERLMDRAIHCGLDDIDGGIIRLKAPRTFTQEISRLIYECTHANGEPAFAGVYYLSRFGDDFPNWAIFEPSGNAAVPLSDLNASPVDRDDADLAEALDLLGLTLR